MKAPTILSLLGERSVVSRIVDILVDLAASGVSPLYKPLMSHADRQNPGILHRCGRRRLRHLPANQAPRASV